MADQIDERAPIDLIDVTWSGERFVAVGWRASIAYSADGMRWHRASDSATRQNLSSVVASGTDVVAFGNRGAIVRAATGIAGGRRPTAMLRCRRSPLSRGTARGFIALAGDGTFLHSSDGDRWESGDHTTWDYLTSVTWSGDRLVAVGFGSILHSSDGDSWRTASDRATDTNLEGVASSGERFVAVGRGGTIVYSGDGDRWVQAADGVPSASTILFDVEWGEDRFVAVGWERLSTPETRPSCTARTAIAGRPGALPPCPIGSSYYGVAWGDDRFVAVGSGETVYSRDGITWDVARVTPDYSFLSAVAWGGGRFVAVGTDGTIMHSLDGNSWERGGPTAPHSTGSATWPGTASASWRSGTTARSS